MTTMMVRSNVFAGVALQVLLLAKSTHAAPRSLLADLPWDTLDSSAPLVDASMANYVQECLPVFELPEANRSNHDLIDQPSGLCMDHLYCGFVGCNPMHDKADEMTVYDRWGFFIANGGANPPIDVSLLEQWLSDENAASSNLPHKVFFPQRAGDVVAAVAFAKDHSIGVSVKNSGHSYTGASTKKDTLLLNMNQYQQYSSTAAGLFDCSSSNNTTTTITSDLHRQLCDIAMSRNKPGVVRVGGGENFDKVYRAVKQHNEALSPNGYRYHLVGGAAGTVSPLGWTFQGGLSGTTNGRVHGFGVDQVVMLDMVLPGTGQHVRFGPVEWQAPQDENYVIPQTTQVAGKCHDNPQETDEELWTWSECEEDINFDDLWFAVRGGGGGTFGIVTSVYLQLHEYQPLSTGVLGVGHLAACGIPMFLDPITFEPNPPVFDAFGGLFWKFIIQFFLDPVAIGVSEDDSNHCGAPAFLPGTVVYSCYGQGAGQKLIAAWEDYVLANNETLLARNMTQEHIGLAVACPTILGGVTEAVDYPEQITIRSGPHAGKAKDDPVPQYATSTEGAANILIPKDWILENMEAAIALFHRVPGTYWAFGGNTKYAQDQANSLSDAHRNAGMMIIGSLTELEDPAFWAEMFPSMYDTSDPSNFPGFIGSNHAGPNTRGPLKSDWTQPCPLSWTQSDRDAKCVPLQEAIWGTSSLQRLEAIKQAVDPNYMLDCNFCIGNNRVAAAAGSDETKADSTGNATTPPGPPEDSADDAATPTSSAPKGFACVSSIWAGATILLTAYKFLF